MDITVLVKVVTDRATLEPEAPTGLARRTEGSSFLNPFDQRALRAAVDLRRSGERISVVSMGPAYAERILAPYLGAGIDRILLLSDDRLRGSDVVATARTLARVLRPLGRQIVLTGDRATDSAMGVLAAALSPHLWFPAIAGVRSIVRDASGVALTVTADTENGWARYAVRAPCILSVGEKIARPLRPPSEEGSSPRSVERLSLDTLPQGPSGAPYDVTRVGIVRWERIERTRAARVYPPSEVEEGLTTLRTILRSSSSMNAGHPPNPDRPVAPVPGAIDREVLVLVTGSAGELEPRALPVLSRLASSLPGHWCSAIWVGPHPPPDALRQLASAGAARGYGLHGPKDPVLPVVAALALERVLDRRPATKAIVLPESGFGRQAAGRLASRIGRGLVTDVERVTVEGTGKLLWTKPSFGSQTWVTVSTAGGPSIALLRPGNVSAPSVAPSSASLDWIDVPIEVPSVAIRPLDTGREVGPEFGSLDRARIVVGVGMGMGGPEAIRTLLPLLGATGAALAATRRVVDAGWVPPQLQVGLTGRSIAPRLGILVGISGSPNHTIGWRLAETLVAVNVDAKAPVFSGVDLGFVGPWEELLPRVLDAAPHRH